MSVSYEYVQRIASEMSAFYGDCADVSFGYHAPLQAGHVTIKMKSGYEFHRLIDEKISPS